MISVILNYRLLFIVTYSFFVINISCFKILSSIEEISHINQSIKLIEDNVVDIGVIR